MLRATAPCLVSSCLPLINNQSCFPYRALSVRGGADRGWHRPHLSNSCIPAPKIPSGTWLLHSGKADPRDPWMPPGQLRACLPTYHGQGLSSSQPPCAMLLHQRRLQWQPHHAAAAPVRKLKAQLKSSGIFCQGKHLWSAWCSQDTGTLGLGQRPCPPAKAEVASESKWKFYQHSCEAGAQAPSAHGAKEAVPFLWRPGCWHLELASAN